MTKTLDGNFSLAELQQTLTTQEQLGFVRLSKLEKSATPPPANVATFDTDAGPDPPPAITLVEISPGTDLARAVSDQRRKGRTLVCNSTIFVKGTDSNVAVFR